MLDKKERKVMNIVYGLCGQSRSCLCCPWDLLRCFSAKEKMSESALEKVLCDLQSDGYLDVVFSDRRGEKMYVLSLRGDGQSYRRENLLFRRNVRMKALLAVLGAVLSFFVGLILRRLFLS